MGELSNSVPQYHPPNFMELAGFGRRYLALLLDLLFLEILGGCITAPYIWISGIDPSTLFGNPALPPGGLQGLLMAYMGLLGALWTWYFTWFHSQGGQTPGKWLFGLTLIHKDGRSLSPGTALIRFWGGLLGALLTLGLSYSWAGWDSWRQALHDKFCDSIVVIQSKHQGSES